MTDLEKRIKREAREWWLKDNNYSKLLDLERLIMKFVKSETDLLSQHIVELQKDKERLTDEVNIMQQRFIDTSNNWRDKCTQLEDKDKQAKEIIHDLLQIGVFQFPFQDNEANYLNKQITAKAEAFLKEQNYDRNKRKTS